MLQIFIQWDWLKCTETMSQLYNGLVGMISWGIYVSSSIITKGCFINMIEQLRLRDPGLHPLNV